jgi:hypothetical protein
MPVLQLDPPQGIGASEPSPFITNGETVFEPPLAV